MMNKDKDKNKVQSIERAFKILEQFSVEEDELSITEIKAMVGLPISTVHRLLITLEGLGYISQNDSNGKYRLGLNAFILGSKVKALRELGMISRNYIKSLFDKYNETVHFAIEHDFMVLCVEKYDAQRKIVYTPGVGEKHLLHVTSVGKSILAFYSEEKRNRIVNHLSFKPLTCNTITDKDKFLEELRMVAERGYSVDNEESEIGLICVGVPVFGYRGYSIGGISMSIPKPRFVYEIEQIAEDLKSAAKKMSEDLISKNYF